MQTSAKVGILAILVLFLVASVAAEDATEWYTKAQNAAATGDYTDAVTYYNNAIALNPTYDAAYAGDAAALNALGQYSAALTAANQALAIRSSPTALGARADALFYLGRYNDAVGAYQNYTAVVYNHASAYCNLGYSYVQVNDSANALTPYSQCTNLNSTDPLAWNQLGLVYMSLGQYSNALNAYTKATGITISNPDIWNNKGEALVALGRYQDAIDCFNTALSLDPNYTPAQENKAAVNGKGQISINTNTPTPTQAPWYLGGVTPTSATPTPVATLSVTGTPTVETTSVPQTTQATPVPTRTTFAPLSPVPAFVGLGAAAMFLARAGKRKGR
ncbi:tetratricopeptide repeat protein [Methanoregula sp.]|uniref:tetratricopeptide repeat protein n=1 Tax=Methanoregula sp. TaxID=2052170 RepID=UPI002C321B22|nr:tetratricopeptide repeat protein [Methanoregula sp.]HVP95816.1 tetratricopeptide repeat protein [Methanoregula sp.]